MDEKMIEEIGKIGIINDHYHKNKPNLWIFDCRPYSTAFGNKMKGKGYENVSNYKNCHPV